MQKIIKYFKILHWKYIRPIKNFIRYGKAFSQNVPSECWGELYKLVLLKTEDFIKFSKKRDTFYVNGEHYLKKAKILNECSRRLFYETYLDQITPYDKEIEELKEIWKENCGLKQDDFSCISFHIKERQDDGSTLYTPVRGGIAERYHKLVKIRYKHQENCIKDLQNIFFKELRHLEDLAW